MQCKLRRVSIPGSAIENGVSAISLDALSEVVLRSVSSEHRTIMFARRPTGAIVRFRIEADGNQSGIGFRECILMGKGGCTFSPAWLGEQILRKIVTEYSIAWNMSQSRRGKYFSVTDLLFIKCHDIRPRAKIASYVSLCTLFDTFSVDMASALYCGERYVPKQWRASQK